MTLNVENATVEQLLDHAAELLRCASATAYESADSLKGPQRDHAFSVVHLVKMAEQVVKAASEVGR